MRGGEGGMVGVGMELEGTVDEEEDGVSDEFNADAHSLLLPSTEPSMAALDKASRCLHPRRPS